MDIKQVNLKDDNFSPIPTFVRILTMRPVIGVPILLLGFLPSFCSLMTSLFLPEPTKNFWFYLNASSVSFFSVLLSSIVGKQLLSIFRESPPHRINFAVIFLLATASFVATAILMFLPTYLTVPFVVEAALPILSTYLTFVVLNISITYVDFGKLPLDTLRQIFKASNKRIGYGFSIGLSLILLLFAVLLPVLLVSIFQTFLLFNKIYFFFFISLLMPTFSSIFFLSYLRKEYFSPVKPSNTEV